MTRSLLPSHQRSRLGGGIRLPVAGPAPARAGGESAGDAPWLRQCQSDSTSHRDRPRRAGCQWHCGSTVTRTAAAAAESVASVLPVTVAGQHPEPLRLPAF